MIRRSNSAAPSSVNKKRRANEFYNGKALCVTSPFFLPKACLSFLVLSPNKPGPFNACSGGEYRCRGCHSNSFFLDIQGQEQLHELNKCLLVKKLSVKIFEENLFTSIK